MAELEPLAVEAPTSDRFNPNRDRLGEDVRALRLERVPEFTARMICEDYHYIRSHRPDSDYFGLSGHGLRVPATLFVVSPVDGGLAELVDRTPLAAERVLVLARVFSFHDAPKNAISYGLARLTHMLADECASSLVTYVNPNVGFTGSSYLASGWTHVASEPVPWYSYLDGRYATARDLEREHGVGYEARLGARLERSRQRLAPLDVYGRRLPRC